MRGKFISFEGPEGAGKSTHIATLMQQLQARGIPVLCTREPGGTKLGEAIRGLLQFNTAGEAPNIRAELLLFLASRAQIVEQVIRPALEAGTWVLCDRFCDSTLAYQGYGRGLPLPTLREINAFATGGLMPDITLLLDIPLEESQRRLVARAGMPGDRFEQEKTEFHKRLRDGFLELAAQEPKRMFVIESLDAQDKVAAQIAQIVLPDDV